MKMGRKHVRPLSDPRRGISSAISCLRWSGWTAADKVHETVIGNLSCTETIAFPGLQSSALVSVPRARAMVVLFGLTHCGLMAHWVQNSERQDLMRLMGTMRYVSLLRWFGMRTRIRGHIIPPSSMSFSQLRRSPPPPHAPGFTDVRLPGPSAPP